MKTNPIINESTRAEAHQLAQSMATAARARGCIVDVTSDDNGLPVINYTLPPAIEQITLNITVSTDR